jgi:hypothetical protein
MVVDRMMDGEIDVKGQLRMHPARWSRETYTYCTHRSNWWLFSHLFRGTVPWSVQMKFRI